MGTIVEGKSYVRKLFILICAKIGGFDVRGSGVWENQGVVGRFLLIRIWVRDPPEFRGSILRVLGFLRGDVISGRRGIKGCLVRIYFLFGILLLGLGLFHS